MVKAVPHPLLCPFFLVIIKPTNNTTEEFIMTDGKWNITESSVLFLDSLLKLDKSLNISDAVEDWKTIKVSANEAWVPATIRIGDNVFTGKIYHEPFNIASVEANLIKWIPDEQVITEGMPQAEEGKDAASNINSKTKDFVKPTTSADPSTDRIHSTSSKSAS